jgi:hypothetical protein
MKLSIFHLKTLNYQICWWREIKEADCTNIQLQQIRGVKIWRDKSQNSQCTLFPRSISPIPISPWIGLELSLVSLLRIQRINALNPHWQVTILASTANASEMLPTLRGAEFTGTLILLVLATKIWYGGRWEMRKKGSWSLSNTGWKGL